MAFFEKVNSSKRFHYILNDQFFIRYSTQTDIKYLECVFEDCTIIKNRQLKLNKAPAKHESENTIIREVRLRAESRKQSANNNSTTLGNIFDKFILITFH